MSADDERPAEAAAGAAPDLKERYRRAIAFLQRARELPELTPAQLDRIERRLHQPRAAARRPLLSPALAALFVLLLAGGAVAMAGRDLTQLPGVGHWIGALLGHGRTSHAGARPPQPQSSAVPATAGVRALPKTSIVESPARPGEGARAIVPATAAAKSLDSPLPAHEARLALAEPHHAVAHAGAAPAAPGAAPAAAVEPAYEAPAPTPALSPAPPATTEPPPATPTPAATVAAPAVPRSSPPEPAAATPENPIVAESRSFASALALWHRDHDALAALAALDAHERRFPAGQIQLEARLLRAEILLAGNRESEALALLDQLALGGLPRALRTVRGELRINAGRCADGKADLQAVLANDDSDAFARRARKALAACR